jgi:serine/threonine-protein kinase
VTAEHDLFRRAEEVFLRVTALPEAGRAAAIDDACRADAALAREVCSLLDHARRMGSFLEEPALGADFGLPSQDSWTADDLSGQLVGRYRLERCIGWGGMGTVYLATRADAEFSQRVAIKLVKRGMDSDEILRRFRAERQTLAALHHPNIALLLDGGVTDSGQPYLVMEYVEGEPIDRYCDRHRLPVEARLALFLTICDAVRHAHQNLVIHRDLKPANILVSRDGIPKLVDFGIAKLIAPGERPHATTPQERRLTPEYASPEQVTGRPVTTSSDIYSLGVILYELLCGHQPYRFPTRTPAEIERVVADGTASLPSEAVTRVEGNAPDDARVVVTPDGVGQARSARPDALARRLRGDLDTIVLMALRKEPERRYASVDHLAGDIRRHLAGLPVSAHRDTFGYRFAKFARRHRVGTALGAVAVLLLGAAVSTVIWQARVASRQRDAALAAREQSEATVQFLQEMLASVDPGERGRGVTVREVLDAAAVRVDTELASQPLVQAMLRTTIGRTYLSLGLLDASETQLRSALEQRRALLGPRHRAVADCLCDLSDVLYARQSLDEAQAAIEQALDIYRDTTTLVDTTGDRSADLPKALSRLGAVQWAKGELKEAEEAHRQALAIRREVRGADGIEVAESLNALGVVFLAQGRQDEAEPLLTEALEIRRNQLGPEHPLVAETLGNLAVALNRKGDLVGAEQLYLEELELGRRLLGDAHPEVAVTRKNLAMLYLQRGDLAAAEEQLRACVATREACFPPTDHRVFLTQLDLADVLEQRGEWDAASVLLERALDSARSSTAPREKRTLALDRAAKVFQAHGDTERVAALLDEARREPEMPDAPR